MNWLDTLVEGAKYNESPSRFFWWSGVAAIAASVRKQIYIDRHFYKLYLNVFVALISARSGLRKGVPISIVKGIIEDLNEIRVMSGCNSIQGLTHELGMQKTFETGKVLSDAQGILLSDEFASFLTEDSNALTILTALHNTHEHEKQWTKTLKNSPLETLKSPCLSLLVASNETLLHTMIQDKDMEGGFIARTFIVYESNRRMVNSLVFAPPTKMDREYLTAELRAISEVKGVFSWTAKAGDYYDAWYQKLCQRATDDRTGTMERLGDQVIKVAMIVDLASGAGRTRPLEITLASLKDAIEKTEECLTGVKTITMGDSSASCEQDQAIPKIIKALLVAPDATMSRQRILTKTGLDAMIFDRALTTLTDRETLLPPFRGMDGKVCYRLCPDVVDAYTTLKGGG